MSLILSPDISLEVSSPLVTDDVQLSETFGYYLTAKDLNKESGSSVDGRYKKDKGHILGRAVAKAQDTYLFGTGSRTGRAFDVNSGTWKDDLVSPRTGAYMLFFPDASDGASFGVTDHTPGTEMLNAEIIVHRGWASKATTKNVSTCYAYLELNVGSTNGKYRLALEWDAPIRLDYQAPRSSNWQRIAIASSLGSVADYLASHDHQIQIKVEVFQSLNLTTLGSDGIGIEIGQGHFLQHVPRDTSGRNIGLPNVECYRFYGANGWAGLEVNPLRYQAVRVTKPVIKAGRNIPNMADAALLIGSAGVTPPTAASTAVSVGQDAFNNVSVDYQASNTDAGDGLGSAKPPVFTDGYLDVPAVWGTTGVGILPSAAKAMRVSEIQVFDDIARVYTSSAKVIINNRYGEWTGSTGNLSCNLAASNGIDIGQRLRGVIAGAPGVTNKRLDPLRVTEALLHDFSYKLNRPLGQRLVCDNWCIYSAVHKVLEIGQISPRFRRLIPYYRPGRAGYDCPYQILGGGMGLNPKYEYGPERTCWSVLLELVQDAAQVDPFIGREIPFVTGFLASGDAVFLPYNPLLIPISESFSDTDTGYGQILEIHATRSIENMRTSIDFQGLDPFSGELLWFHQDLAANLPWVGWRFPWFERNSRWLSQQYLQDLGRSASILASLPMDIVHMKVPFNPMRFAGQMIYVSERQALGRAGLFIINVLQSDYGLKDISGRRGERDCTSWITARSYESFIPLF